MPGSRSLPMDFDEHPLYLPMLAVRALVAASLLWIAFSSVSFAAMVVLAAGAAGAGFLADRGIAAYIRLDIRSRERAERQRLIAERKAREAAEKARQAEERARRLAEARAR